MDAHRRERSRDIPTVRLHGFYVAPLDSSSVTAMVVDTTVLVAASDLILTPIPIPMQLAIALMHRSCASGCPEMA